MFDLTKKQKIKYIIEITNALTHSMGRLEEEHPDIEVSDLVGKLDPSIVSVRNSLEKAYKKLHDYPDGRAYKVTTVFTEEVFARSSEEALALHTEYLTMMAKEDNLGASLAQSSENANATETECFISFRHRRVKE